MLLGCARARCVLRGRRQGTGSSLATALTRGPWDPGAQHAGPPAALLARAIEQLPDSERFQVARVTFEILRPVPIGPVLVAAASSAPAAASAWSRPS